jgi:predicted nucleic acid-binding protein
MPVLIDTSVWIDHLRGLDVAVTTALLEEEVLAHSFVIGELACGNLRNRRELVSLWTALPHAPMASHEEVLVFIDQHRLMGLGLGYVDVHLLAATALHGSARLWTRDRRLAAVATRMRLAYAE